MADDEVTDGEKGSVGLTWIRFLEEEGDREVVNPDTGNKVKVKSLNRADRPKSEKLLTDLFQKWKEQQESGGDEDSEGGDEDSEDDDLVEIDPEEHHPSDEVAEFLDGTEGPVKDVFDAVSEGKSPARQKLQQAWMQTVRSLTLSNLDKDQLAGLRETEKWLRGIADSVTGEESAPKRKRPSKPKKKPKDEGSEEGDSEEEDADSEKSDEDFSQDYEDDWEADKSDEEIRREFIKNNPEEKDRIEAMDDDEFEEYVEALMAQGKGSKKKSHLRGSVVRLAYLRRDMRAILLGALVRTR